MKRCALPLALLLLSALALTPPLRRVIDKAEDTHMRGKARALWTCAVCAGLERRERGLPPVWPEDVRWGEPPKCVEWQSAAQYFRYLMSTGDRMADPLLAVPAAGLDGRVAPELSAAFLSGVGVKTAPSDTALSDAHCAWHVCRIGEDAPADTPFLISRNVVTENGRLVREGNGSALVPLRKVAPFGRRRAVWMVRGGGVFSAPARQLTQAILLPGTNRVEVIVSP